MCYSELVNNLRCCNKDVACDECTYFHDEEKCCGIDKEAADAIEELLARDVVPTDFHERCLQLEIRKRIELEKQMPHWISVEERLPEPFVCVLAHIPGEKPFQTVKSAFLEKNGLWYSNGFRYNPEEVTHWCEMPAPPKEVE